MRVMVAENDSLHRDFLRETVESMMSDGLNDLIEAENGAEAIRLDRAHAPECVILDLQLPEATGVEVAKTIWRNRPATRILFWSNYADEAYVRGVSRIVPPEATYGYVLKSASEERLSFAIRGVFFEDQCIIDREVRGVQQRAEDRQEGLTDSEYEILIDVAIGLTDKAIASLRHLSIRGVQSRLQHLYEKLAVSDAEAVHGIRNNHFNSRTRAVFLAFARGLLNVEDLRREHANRIDGVGRAPSDGDVRHPLADN